MRCEYEVYEDNGGGMRATEQKITLYASYGMLAHEKRPAYSEGAHGDIYDAVTVELPDYITRHEGADGCGIYDINGALYRLTDLIFTTPSGAPGFAWYDGAKNHCITLRVVHPGCHQCREE